jgi:DNA repair exonuclease SbcCD ATPase subunit
VASEELDRQLRDFLEEARRDRASGFTTEMVIQRLLEHAAEDSRRFDDVSNQLRAQRIRTENVEVALDKTNDRIKEVKEDVRDLRSDLKATSREVDEITGSHHIPPGAGERSSWVNDLAKGSVKWFVWAAFLAAGGGLGALVHALLSAHG